jgi:topoisomerase-4 subunit B
MDPGKRTLLRVTIAGTGDENPGAEEKKTSELVEQLMGRKPELRFAFIQENARFVHELDV